MKLLLLIVGLFVLVGCHNDTRVRVDPKINLDDLNLTDEEKRIYRLHIMRELYNRKVLRDFENETNQANAGLLCESQ